MSCRANANRLATMLVTTLATGLTALTGCTDLLVLFGARVPQEWLEERAVVGGTAEHAVFALTHRPGQPPGLRPLAVLTGQVDPASLEYEPPRTELVVVNLQTLESARPAAELTLPGSLRTDGRWLAAFNWNENAVRVMDLRTGEMTTRLAGLAPRAIYDVLAVGDPYLVVQTGVPSQPPNELLVLNLLTDAQRLISPAYLAPSFIGPSDLPASLSLRGDRLAMVVYDPVESGGAWTMPATGRIEIVNLSTGERATFLDDVAAAASPLVVLEDDRLLVLSSAYRSPATVRGYPLDGGEPHTLLELELGSSLTVGRVVEAFNAHGLIVRAWQVGAPIVGPYREQFHYWSLDGQAQLISDHELPVVLEMQPIVPRPSCTLVDRFVLYYDPDSNDYRVLDVMTRTERRFDPFAR